jgi:hypothetical protein
MSIVESNAWAPTVNARVNAGHPQAAGLISALLPIAGVGAVDLTSGERHSLRGAPDHGATTYGYGMTNPAAGDGTDYTIGSSHKLALQPPLSFMWVGDKVGNPDPNSLMFGVYYDNASGSPFTCYGLGFDGAATGMRCPEGNSAGTYVGFATFTTPGSGPHVYICVIDPGGIQGWDNGVQQVTNSGWSSINYSATSGFTFHNHPTARAVGHTATFGAVWNRSLSANEIGELTVNPFTMLRPEMSDAYYSTVVTGAAAGQPIAKRHMGVPHLGMSNPIMGRKY